MTQPGHQCGQNTSCSDQMKSSIDSLTTNSRITSHLPGTAAHSQAIPLLPKELGNTQVSPEGVSSEQGPQADVLHQDLSLKSSSLKAQEAGIQDDYSMSLEEELKRLSRETVEVHSQEDSVNLASKLPSNYGVRRQWRSPKSLQMQVAECL